MSLALLNRQPVTWDSEAASYLTSVESADTQSLELPVARAINQFVIDCKVRGIWNAIKSSCLLCGPRTLSGALVPLKGVAPTSYNFVSSDYNRETGLKGNGSNKYLDTGRPNNADPQDNNHMSVYVTSPETGTGTYLASGAGVTGNSQIWVNAGNAIYFRNHCLDTIEKSTFYYANPIGFIAHSRSSSSQYINRFSGNSAIAAISSQTPNITNIRVFDIPNFAGYTGRGRLNFYSIGESLDLRLLEQCVEKYINMINILI